MKWIVKSDIGVVRSENQDNAAVFEKDGIVLAILCDGMGGHFGGSLAAETTIKTFEKEFHKGVQENKVSLWFASALKKTKKEMKKIAGPSADLLDMGTTLTTLIIFPEKVYIYNIGDSRTYAYNELLHQITRDHNLRNYYIDKYQYTPEEAAKVMGAAALTSALGPEKTTIVDQFVLDIDKSIKYFILTSDGIHDYVSKPQFEKILEDKDSIENKAIELIKHAIIGKSSDNLTVILIDTEGSTW